jgi:hypothetical protein
MFVEGANNHFNEPPDNIWLLYLCSLIYIIYYQIDCIYESITKLEESLYLKFKNINKYKYFIKHNFKIINLLKLELKLLLILKTPNSLMRNEEFNLFNQ